MLLEGLPREVALPVEFCHFAVVSCGYGPFILRL